MSDTTCPLNHARLAAWLLAAHADIGGKTWWPRAGRSGQGTATSWCWAFVLRAARDMGLPATTTLQLSLPWHGATHKDVRHALVEKLWINKHRTHSPYEVLLDYSVAAYSIKGAPIQLTGESEMYAYGGVGPQMGNTTNGLVDDYTWDFYKLMLVPSPRRLFMARVGAIDRGESEAVRIRMLEQSLSTVMGWYGQGLVGTAELGIVILPDSAKTGMAGVRLGVWEGDAITWKNVEDR